MAEGNTNMIDLSEYEVPELEVEEGLVVVHGPMRCNKTTIALEYARMLDEDRQVMAFRPTQDLRHAEDHIESQNPRVEPFPAMRTPSLAPVAMWDVDVVAIDEPHFWANDDAERTPHEPSFRAVERILDKSGLVIVSTLDRNYMAAEFEWFRRLKVVGEHIADMGLGVQFVQVGGYCELCPRDDFDAIGQSEYTNLYINGEKQHAGSPNIPEENREETVYVPCCAACVEANKNERLADDYEPLEGFLKAA